jgi:hypothetical protein
MKEGIYKLTALHIRLVGGDLTSQPSKTISVLANEAMSTELTEKKNNCT